MFFVFGPSGQMFRGGPENLEQISGVRRVGRLQALRTRPVEDEGGTPVAPFPLTGGAASAAPARAAPAALAAYASAAQLPKPERQPLTRVQEVMTSTPFFVRPGMRVNAAWQALADHGVAQAPVVDELQRVVGLLLRADMAPLDLLPQPGAVQAAIDLARRPVREVMVSPVPAVDATTSLRRLAQALLNTGLPGLPVTNELGVLVGFVSRTDILRAVAADPPLDLWSGPEAPL